LRETQQLSNISQLSNFVHRTIWARQMQSSINRGTPMRTFTTAFLSAIAAVTISGTLFSVVLV
jgi:hypothetical protein